MPHAPGGGSWALFPQPFPAFVPLPRRASAAVDGTHGLSHRVAWDSFLSGPLPRLLWGSAEALCRPGHGVWLSPLLRGSLDGGDGGAGRGRSAPVTVLLGSGLHSSSLWTVVSRGQGSVSLGHLCPLCQCRGVAGAGSEGVRLCVRARVPVLRRACPLPVPQRPPV